MDGDKQAEISEAIASLNELIEKRNKELAFFEERIVFELRTGRISFLNPVTDKRKQSLEIITLASLKLECKMLRRNLFFLQVRKRRLQNQLEKAA